MLKELGKKLNKMSFAAIAGCTGASDIGCLVEPDKALSIEPKTLVQNLINYLLFFVGVIALVFVVYGGILMVTSGGDAEKAKKGRDTLLYAILGIIVIVLAYAIISWATGSGADTLKS